MPTALVGSMLHSDGCNLYAACQKPQRWSAGLLQVLHFTLEDLRTLVLDLKFLLTKCAFRDMHLCSTLQAGKGSLDAERQKRRAGLAKAQQVNVRICFAP